MNCCTYALRLALTLALGALLPLPAQAQIVLQALVKVSVNFQDGGGAGTLSIVPQEDPQSTLHGAPYRSLFWLERGGNIVVGVGIYQYLPSSQNYMLAWAWTINGQVFFYQGKTFVDPNNPGIVGGGTYFIEPNREGDPDPTNPAKSWQITQSGTGTGTGTGTSDLSQQAAQVLTLLNQSRQAGGQAPLRRASELDQAAMGHALDMAKQNVLSTRGSDGSSIGERLTRAGYAWRAAGELVGVNSTPSAQSLVASLTGDLSSRQLLLSSAFTECGIAIVAQPGTTNRFYWCVDLGAR